MKALFFLLPFLAFSQYKTLNLDRDYKLLSRTYEIDTLIGNGYTLYFHCQAELTVKHYIENVRLSQIRLPQQKCRYENDLFIKPTTVVDRLELCTLAILVNVVYEDGRIRTLTPD